jgi:[ribosomal protein S5]-alanine N-acetyltransferase
VRVEDAAVLAELVTANREFMARWDPARDDDFFTLAAQRTMIGAALERKARGLTEPHVILDEEGRVVGRINLHTIVRAAFQSCNVGYWVSQQANGRGLATAAVRRMKQVAFGELGLHRIEAGTLPDNFRSQRVLERNGFERFGLAPNYLKIAGKWQDHVLFQVLNPES